MFREANTRKTTGTAEAHSTALGGCTTANAAEER